MSRHGSHRRSTAYRYREPWRGPGPEDQGPSEPLFHYPHSKQYYVQQQQRERDEQDEEGRRSQSTSPQDYSPHSPKVDLDRPSRSPSPHPTVSCAESNFAHDGFRFEQDQAKTEYYGTTKLEQRSRSPSPTQSTQSIPFQIRRFPGRFLTGAKRRLLPSTPGSIKKKKQPPEHLHLGKVDASLVINFPLVSHSPTIPTRSPATINFPKLNASPTHYMKHAPHIIGASEYPQTTDEQQLMQLPPPLQPQPGVWIPAPGGTMAAPTGMPQGFGEFPGQQPMTEAEYTAFQQQQQQQQQQSSQQSTSRFAPVGASLSTLFAPLRVFGGRSSSLTRQPSPTPQQTIDQTSVQVVPNAPVTMAAVHATAAAPSVVIKRSLFGEKRELPQPPPQSALYYPSGSAVTGPSGMMQPTLPTWPEESAAAQSEFAATSTAKPISDIQPLSYNQPGFVERLPSQESLPGGTTAGRMLPPPPGQSSQAPASSIMMRSLEFPRAKARERMKIRSSTWTDETYGPEDYYQKSIVGTGPRRRQPSIPSLIKRPSSAGILMTPGISTTASRQQPPLISSTFSVGSHQQSRRITPPVPRARRKAPIHQHSFHSDGADVSRPEDEDDDDDEDWC